MWLVVTVLDDAILEHTDKTKALRGPFPPLESHDASVPGTLASLLERVL